MNKRKLLYTIAGIFNCVIGGIGAFFGLMILFISKVAKNMFSSSTEIIDEFVNSLARESSKYEYLLNSSNEEIISFIMKIVYLFSLFLLICGIIWIVFGVFNLKLSSRHYSFWNKHPRLKLWFVIGTWVLMLFNVANILTTIAVYLKDKENPEINQPLYNSED